MQTNPIFSPGKSLGERSLAGYSLSSHEELDMTEHTHILSLLVSFKFKDMNEAGHFPLLKGFLKITNTLNTIILLLL